MSIFVVGDRVTQQRVIGQPKEGRRHGTVTERYKSSSGVSMTPHWLFAVRWDDKATSEKGYLEHGLERE